MEGVVRLKHIGSYKKVNYYSVCLDNDELPVDSIKSLFELFIEENQNQNKDKLNHILVWLSEIGNKYGANERFFRPEESYGEAKGLPPKNKFQPVYTEDGESLPNNLRLYCHVLNESVVILFSGGIKTQDQAQQCPNVKNHFLLANKLTRIIDNAIKERDIIWVKENQDIDYSEDLIIYY